MFHLLPTKSNFPFMKYRTPTLFVSVVAVALAIYCLATKGLNYGVDFAGGIQIVLELPEDSGASAERLRASLKRIGVKDAAVQAFGTDFDKKEAEYMINFSSDFADNAATQNLISRAFVVNGKGAGIVSEFRFSGMEKGYLKLTASLPIQDVRKVVGSISFDLLELLDVQPFGSETSNEYQISFHTVSSVLQRELNKDFVSPTGKKIVVRKVDFVGAKVGKDLKVSALLSILITILLIFVYIFMRFDLINRNINNSRKTFSLELPSNFANSVIHNNRVVNRITRQSQ